MAKNSTILDVALATARPASSKAPQVPALYPQSSLQRPWLKYNIPTTLTCSHNALRISAAQCQKLVLNKGWTYSYNVKWTKGNKFGFKKWRQNYLSCHILACTLSKQVC